MNSLSLDNNQIHNIAIVDDIAEARNSVSEMLEDAGYSPIPCAYIKEHSLGEFASRIIQASDAAVIDHNLSTGGYADFNGAEAVEYLYDKKFPSILLTTMQGYELTKIVAKRRKIPCLIDGSKVDAHQISEGLERCVKELKQDLPSDRRPYRTIARLESIDLSEPHRRVVDLIIPAWSASKSVQLPYDYVHSMINVDLQPDMHLVADVNIGAECGQDLFVENIEVAKEIDNELAKLIRT